MISEGFMIEGALNNVRKDYMDENRSIENSEGKDRLRVTATRPVSVTKLGNMKRRNTYPSDETGILTLTG